MTILPPKGKSSAAHRKYFNENYHICFPSLFNLRCCGEPSLTSTKRFSASNFAPTWKRLVKTSHSYQGTIPVNQSCLTYMLLFLSCEIVKITKSYPGRSANVRTPLWPVHGFSLRDVQLHQISGPRSPGDSQ